MSVIMLPGGVLRVPTATTLPNGTKVDGTREVRPDDPEYPHWLPYAQREAELWQGTRLSRTSASWHAGGAAKAPEPVGPVGAVVRL